MVYINIYDTYNIKRLIIGLASRNLESNIMATKTQSKLSFTTKSGNEKQDKTRNRIVDAALACFIESGLRKTSMEDVASRAGIGRATLYRRFKDKDELIQSVILTEAHKNLALLEKQIVQIESPLEGLLEAFVQAAMAAHKHPLFTQLLVLEPDYVMPFLTSRAGSVLQFASAYLAVQISKAQQAGFISNRPATTTAEMILRFLQSLLLSPKGIINPGNEESLRLFSETYLRPLLEPSPLG